MRLRALVLLPSRDLAMQVHAVFKRYARGTGLRVGLAIGQTNFLEEQLALVGPVALAGKTTCWATRCGAGGELVVVVSVVDGVNIVVAVAIVWWYWCCFGSRTLRLLRGDLRLRFR